MKISPFLFVYIKTNYYICQINLNDMELIHVACFIKEKPLETKNDLVILGGEAWRDKDQKQTHRVKISLETDLYLDCLSTISSIDTDVSLYFLVTDSWKALKKVFKQPQFAFVLESNFSLMAEQDDDMVIIKEF